MSKREQLICAALDAAKAQGIKIWPGAVFDWTDQPSGVILKEFRVPGPSGPLPSACNATGAMDLLLGRTREGSLNHSKICEYLNVGGYWMYRFSMGFDRGYQIVYKVEGKKKKLIDKQCEVSKMGLKLRKKYIGW